MDYFKFRFNKLLLFISLLHFLLNLFLCYFFTFIDVFKTLESTIFYILSMMICCAFFIILYQLIYNLILKLKIKSPRFVRFVKYFLIYFAILFVFYLLTFPGNYVNDEFTILVYSKRFILYGWHHVLTQLFYILAMFTFISPLFIVLFQIIFLSAIVGFIIEKVSFFLNLKMNLKKINVICLFIPFCLPPVILFALNPLRATLCTFLELLIVVELIAIFIKFDKPTIPKLIEFGVLIPIIGLWRTESIPLYVIFIFALLLSIRKNLTKKLVSIFLSTIIICSCFIYLPQKYAMQKTKLDNSMFQEWQDPTYTVTPGENTTFDNYYNYVALGSKLIYLIKFAYTLNDPLIDKIDKYINTQLVIELFFNDSDSSDLKAHNAYNYNLNSLLRNQDITKSDINELYSLYIKLTLKYLGPIFIIDFILFLSTNGLYDFEIFINNSPNNPKSSYGYGIIEHEICPKLRKVVMLILQGGENGEMSIVGMIIYSLFPAVILLIALAIKYLICFITKVTGTCKKQINFYNFLIILALIIKFGIIFLTAPATFFMYYLCFYLICYFYIFYKVTIKFNIFKSKKTKNCIRKSKIINKKRTKKFKKSFEIFKNKELLWKIKF